MKQCVLFLILVLALCVPAYADDSMRMRQPSAFVDADASTASLVSASNPVSLAAGASGYVYPKYSTVGIQRAGIFSAEATLGSTQATISVAMYAEVMLDADRDHWSPADNAGSVTATYTTTGAMDAKRLTVEIPGEKLRLKFTNNGDEDVTVEGGVIVQW